MAINFLLVLIVFYHIWIYWILSPALWRCKLILQLNQMCCHPFSDSYESDEQKEWRANKLSKQV
jgi:hypothetical protein